MNEAQKRESTWDHSPSGGQPEPALEFEVFDAAKGANLAYRAVFSICPEPRCGCRTVCVRCVQRTSESGPGTRPPDWFRLGVITRQVEMTPELKAAPATLPLAQAVAASLSDRAWDELLDWHWKAKIAVIETADHAKTDISGLPDADDGLMVPLVEVLLSGVSVYSAFGGGGIGVAGE